MEPSTRCRRLRMDRCCHRPPAPARAGMAWPTASSLACGARVCFSITSRCFLWFKNAVLVLLTFQGAQGMGAFQALTLKDPAQMLKYNFSAYGLPSDQVSVSFFSFLFTFIFRFSDFQSLPWACPKLDSPRAAVVEQQPSFLPQWVQQRHGHGLQRMVLQVGSKFATKETNALGHHCGDALVIFLGTTLRPSKQPSLLPNQTTPW